MERFGWSGLWLHIGSSVIGFGLSIADGLLSYLGTIQLPGWAHVLVGLVSAALVFYKGSVKTPAAS